MLNATKYDRWNTTDLRQEIEHVKGEAEAVVALAEAEDRELTAKEQQEFDRMLGKGKPGERGYVRGEIDDLRDQLDRAEKREAAQAAEVVRRVQSGEIRIGDDNQFGTRSVGHGKARWQTNSRGERFAILSKGDRFSDVVAPPCDNAFGHAVLAHLFGPTDSTPTVIRNALKEGTGSAGGFMVGSELLSEVVDLARAKSVLTNAGVRTVAMGSDSMSIPALESDVSVELKGENQALTFSDVVIGERKLSTRTIGAVTAVSRELWEDSASLLAEQLQMWMAATMAQQIDQIGLQGYTSKPVGLLGTAGINSTGSIGAIDWLDVSAAATRIRVNNHEPANAIMHPTIFADLMEIESGDGSTSARNWLNRPPTLDNVGFLQTTACPLAKLVIGDFTRFYMGLRTGIRVELSTEAGDAFQKHQVYVKCTSRFDFVSVDDSAFEILEGITS
ncbi:MAG: phage major capsid protein [Phycisphaera sp. RhM]|nr:phage major capsid protein [Phycisphaera sp. RhM]